ncbi:predicted protein [Naegleria gruberi]|uniref:Predicted protein n=1 Tax=Naegleria gruberi TaxID=5762 RepID=D2W3F8_NAEGR|nr:uncharacterized protein NAEGRDRAFT_82229 [Naegleria gruberi]EFC36413.1 predicted protein [Naegleria gruberi]|eukprot:XP_002669157.1 predicted protein [Naegleria gruberi strain NEG-M]
MRKFRQSNVSAADHLEPDAFDSVIRKSFSVDDIIIAEYDVKGSILSKGTLYICKDRILCKKPKVALEYKQIQSLNCVKKKVSIKLDDSKTEHDLKCKSMEYASSVYNLIKELYLIHQSKPLEKVSLDEKNKKYLEGKMPKLDESATPTEEKQNSAGTGSSTPKGIVSQMLGKSIVDFNVLIVESQDYFDCKISLQKQTIQYSTHELKFTEITEFNILSTPYHIQIKFNNPKIKSLTLLVREYISFTQTLKKKYPNLEISFSPNCRTSKIKGGWCNDVTVLASTENSGGPPIMGLKPPGGMPHKKVSSMVSPVAEEDKNVDDIGKNQPGLFVTSSKKLPVDNSEESSSKAHLRSRSVFTKPVSSGTFTPPASYKLPEHTPNTPIAKRKSDDMGGSSSTPLIIPPRVQADSVTTPQAQNVTSTPTIILSSPKTPIDNSKNTTPLSVATPPIIVTDTTTTAQSENTSSSDPVTTEENKVVVHLNLNRAKQARQRKPSTIHRPQMSKIDEATKERTIEVGAEAGSNAQLDRAVDLNVATKRRASSVKTPKSPVEEGMDTV